MKEGILKISGMSCGHCVNSVKYIINEVQGVVYAEVSLETKSAKLIVEGDESRIKAVVERINSSNQYKAELES